ncbi:hypothetical protein C8F04DRAFT_1175938 [Mycena alexandri]|uniref:Uncharacterized protein n=1 Tax=Mycena alexandri TaxID=1745969 RepID=A0AAD6XEZ5_9AGAR|nr:hypothetical protein C8F04DRAFT_1175938 [Mycena alexandri]
MRTAACVIQSKVHDAVRCARPAVLGGITKPREKSQGEAGGWIRTLFICIHLPSFPEIVIFDTNSGPGPAMAKYSSQEICKACPRPRCTLAHCSSFDTPAHDQRNQSKPRSVLVEAVTERSSARRRTSYSRGLSNTNGSPKRWVGKCGTEMLLLRVGSGIEATQIQRYSVWHDSAVEPHSTPQQFSSASFSRHRNLLVDRRSLNREVFEWFV